MARVTIRSKIVADALERRDPHALWASAEWSGEVEGVTPGDPAPLRAMFSHSGPDDVVRLHAMGYKLPSLADGDIVIVDDIIFAVRGDDFLVLDGGERLLAAASIRSREAITEALRDQVEPNDPAVPLSFFITADQAADVEAAGPPRYPTTFEADDVDELLAQLRAWLVGRAPWEEWTMLLETIDPSERKGRTA